MDNKGIFDAVCQLACELEDTHIHPRVRARLDPRSRPTGGPRVRARLANAFDRAICKAMSINFGYEVPNADYVQQSVFRHAERGVRDYIP